MRIGAARSIAMFTSPHDIPIKYLQESLTDESAEVRERIAWALKEQAPMQKGRTCPDCAEAVPYLRRALKDPDRSVRHSAAMALGAIDPNANEAVPVLVDAVSMTLHQELTLGFAIKTLEWMEQNSEQSIIPILEGLLDHKNVDMRRAAKLAINSITEDAN